MKIGIMGAMPQEVELIRHDMASPKTTTLGERRYDSGPLYGCDVVLAHSRCGKVASASTASTLIHRFDIDLLLFTGVSGSVNPCLSIGDIVIASSLYQHDMNALPLFPRFEIPLTNTTLFRPRADLVDQAKDAADAFLSSDMSRQVSARAQQQFFTSSPKVITGMVATGDEFVTDPLTHAGMDVEGHGRADTVEMEGAAVAQVCEEHNVPYTIIRTISDLADHSAQIDFEAFIEEVAGVFSRGIVRRLIPKLTAGWE